MKICKVDGCEKSVKARGWCAMHYWRWQVHGDPHVVLTGKKPCKIENCDKLATGRGMCPKHYTRWRRHGDPHIVLPPSSTRSGPGHPRWKEVPSYAAFHRRLRKQKGSPSEYQCRECGKEAAQWAYNNTCDDEIQDKQGRYCTHPDHYVPMCVSCHKKFDLAHGNHT